MIDELFQRGNQYAMLEDDILATTKRMVANAFDGQGRSGGKRKRTRRDRDLEHKRGEDIQVYALGHRSEASLDPWQSDNPTPDNNSEQVRFTISLAKLLPII